MILVIFGYFGCFLGFEKVRDFERSGGQQRFLTVCFGGRGGVRSRANFQSWRFGKSMFLECWEVFFLKSDRRKAIWSKIMCREKCEIYLIKIC